MTDRRSARDAMIRRWFQELNPFRVAVVGGSEGDSALATAMNRHTGRRSWAEVLPANLRPSVTKGTTAEGLIGHWDLAFFFGSAGQSVESRCAAVESIRRQSRFVAAALPNEGPNAIPTSVRRRWKTLGSHVHQGEELLLLRGGATAAASSTPRVWYLAPNRQIYGGVKILYNHVDILSTIGINAVLAVEDSTNWPAQWFPWNPERLVFGENIRDMVGPEDTVVIPEFRHSDAIHYAHAKRRLLFVQNQGLARGIGDWERLGYDGVMTLGRPDGIPSFLEENLMRRRCRLPMFAVPNHFDDDGWHEIQGTKRKGSILCLPRKGPEFVARIVREFGDAVTCVENAHQLEMAAAYATADVYVHTGFPEGLGMPIVESMLAGCIACGFSGGGGLDVMSDGRTAYLAEDGNMDELLTAVRKALSSSKREEIRAAGRRAAMRFNRAAAAAALDQCYRRWLPNLPIQKAKRQKRSLVGALLGR
jgi:glycosyltransferase involved in cell wall biosynthesis